MSARLHNTPKACRSTAARAIPTPLPYAAGMALIFLSLTVPLSTQANETANGGAEKTARTDSNKIELSVPLKLNRRYAGDISIRVDMAGDGEIDAQRLLELLQPLVGRDVYQGLLSRIAERKMAPMTELSNEELFIEFDSGLLEVNANLTAASMKESEIGLVNRIAPDPSQFDSPENFTAGLGVTLTQGYVLAGDDKGDLLPARANFQGFAQLGGFDGIAAFYGFDIIEGQEKPFRRRELQLVKDFYQPAIRASLGDINAPITGFQETPPLLGLTIAREYRSIQPFRNIVSSGRGSLVLDKDSKVDVYVNGALSETLNLPAGRFSLTDFPVTTGSNDVQLVVEDETGRVETTDFSFFSQSGLLGEGLVDFAISAGVPRSPTQTGFDYGNKPIATGFVNYGLSSRFTTGVNVQLREERQQIGTSLGIGTPIGLVTADFAQSFGRGGLSGNAIGIDYQRSFNVGSTRILNNATVIKKTRDFSGLSTETFENTKLSAQALLRAQFENGLSVGIAGSLRDEYDRPDEKRLNLNVGKAFDDIYINLSTEFIQTDGQKDRLEATIGVSKRIGNRYTARTQYATKNNSKLVELVRSRQRRLNDISGRAQLFQSADDNRFLSELNFRHNRFDAELDFDVTDPRGASAGKTNSDVKWRVSTFAGYSGGELAIGRRSDEGFVITKRHKSLKDSNTVILDQSGSRSEAKIGWLGPALVPIERAYTPRKYQLDVDPLPDGYDIGSGQINVLPGLGMGYVHMIGSDASRTILGTVKDTDGQPLKLVVGVLEHVNGDEEKSRQFFTNSAGRMVAERVAPGTYVLVINGRKSKPIEISKDTEGLVNVGEITLP